MVVTTICISQTLIYLFQGICDKITNNAFVKLKKANNKLSDKQINYCININSRKKAIFFRANKKANEVNANVRIQTIKHLLFLDAKIY